MGYAGEFAALGTALCWAVGSNLFAAAGRRMGAAVLNRLRLTVAAVLLSGALLALRGTPWPAWATPTEVGLLALSGLVGFVFGDTWFFRALVILGPGRAALVNSLSPLFTVAIAWPVLREAPGPLALLGIAMTLAGVTFVLLERARGAPAEIHGSMAAGIGAGLLGAIGQSCGYVLSKLAMRDGLDALSATVVRVLVAVVGVWALTLARGAGRKTLAALRDRRASAFMLGGSVFGPFLGVTLSLVALQFIEAGVAASIIASSPVLAILIAARFHRERLTAAYLVGALVAVAGVIVLFRR